MPKKKTVATVAAAVAVGALAIGYFAAQPRNAEPAIRPGVTVSDTITVCSFNIQFLGSFKDRDNAGLAELVKPYDIVVIQELVAPPNDGMYPDATAYTADLEAKAFVSEMTSRGFLYILSGEDTGTGDKIHTAQTSTEWWIVFYKPVKIALASDIPNGFLAEDRSNNDDYERVPYAFAFKTVSGTMDFVLISVHLQPGDKKDEKARRRHELQAIHTWIGNNSSVEKDFIVLGDMNIYSADELADVTPQGFLSLNNECRVTNTNQPEATKGLPYDHVMYCTEYTDNEIDTDFDFDVINLINAMRPTWTSSEPYPGDPYDHDKFRTRYSDHHPVVFRMISAKDDDGVPETNCDKNCPKEKRFSAKCKDGTADTRTGRGACSGHGGVECWECEG